MNTSIQLAKAILIVSTSLLLMSCESHDLGSESSDHIPVNLSLATWDGGAGAIIKAKCASCHTSQRSASVPGNTPDSLNQISNQDFFENSANRGYMAMMLKRLQSTDIKTQMPPLFATPLYDDEKALVTGFLTEKIEALKPVDPPKAYVPVPSEAPAKPTAAPVLSFSDVSDIIAANCGSCHDGTIQFALKTREDFLNIKPTPLKKIEDGEMPADNPDFSNSPEGQLLIKWLKSDQLQ